MHIIVLEKRSAKNFQKKYIRSYRNILPPTKQDCRGLTFCSSTVRFFPATSIHWDMPSINSPFFPSWKPFVPPSGKKKGRHCPEYAYLLGFICHFMLDSEAHTYVNEKAKEKGFNHLVMEMEFDRYLMKKDGIQPFLYPLWRHIRWDKQTLQAVYGVYRHFDLTPRDVKKSLQSMAFYKWLVTTGKTLRRLILRSLMLLSLHYRKLEGHMMDLIPKASAKETNPVLSKIYQNTLAPCRDIIIDFDKTFLNGKPLNPRFQTTFQKRE